tara:strand:+ start:131 stop:547 length:417 start_codon:yes stop_codon:yes gene_type:complete
MGWLKGLFGGKEVSLKKKIPMPSSIRDSIGNEIAAINGLLQFRVGDVEQEIKDAGRDQDKVFAVVNKHRKRQNALHEAATGNWQIEKEQIAALTTEQRRNSGLDGLHDQLTGLVLRAKAMHRSLRFVLDKAFTDAQHY